MKLADEGFRVIIAGLDQDFRGEPFGPMPRLMAVAEHVTKLQAVCTKCGSPASRTQRLINGVPAGYDDPVILVGAKEAYEARCRKHHEVPHRHFRSSRPNLIETIENVRRLRCVSHFLIATMLTREKTVLNHGIPVQ